MSEDAPHRDLPSGLSAPDTEESRSARRDRILTAACKLFHHYGAKKTTVADIAEAAEVGTGSVYLEFSSKTAIVHALSERTLERVAQAMEHELASDRPAPERLARAFTARTLAFAEIAAQGSHAAELLHCTSTPAVQKTWAAFEHRQRTLIAETIAQNPQAFSSRVVVNVELATSSLINAYAHFAPPRVVSLDDDLAVLRDLHTWIFGV